MMQRSRALDGRFKRSAQASESLAAVQSKAKKVLITAEGEGPQLPLFSDVMSCYNQIVVTG